MIFEMFARSKVRLSVANEAESEGRRPPFMLCLRAWLRRSWAHSPSQVVSGWRLARDEVLSRTCHMLALAAGGFRCVSDTPLHHWPLPVTELLRLSPLRGGYSSYHCCDERLELLDTHHTITLDSRGSHC